MILEAGTPVDGGTPEPAAKDWRDAIRNAQTFGDIAAVFEAEFPADYAKYDYAENGVKAKKFKEWFGDWEKAALLGNMRYARGSDQAKAAAKEFIGVPLVNIDTGVTATVSGESLLKMLSKSAYERSVSVQAHMQAIANLDRLFQASAFRMSRDDRKGNENIKEIHHFDVPMKFDGEVLCVKIMAKEYTRKERGTRLYLVQAVEIGKPASCGEGLTSTQEMSSPVAAPPAGYGEKIAHLIDIVNGKITSKVVNPDGSPQETHEIQTPVPVYHGTAKAGFKEFDISKQDKTSLYGPGFYFTENKDVAREYMGKEVVEWATIKEDFRDTFLKVFNMDVMDLGAGALSSDDNQQLFLSDGAVEHLVRDARGFLNSERIKIAMPLVAGKTEANRAVYSCFLNIRNPFDADRDALDMQLLSRNEWMLLFPALVKFSDIEIDDFISKEIKRTTPGGYNYSLLEQQADSKSVANQVLQNVGYDGITHIGGNIMGGGKEHRVWIAFNPNQIKAVENHGTFDPSSGSILESAVQPNQKPTIAQDQSRKAMKFTLDTQKNTMQGASRPDIGWIAFLWGNTGTAPLFADGDGLARIIAKQDFEKKYLPSEQSGRELCMRLVDMLTRGYIKRKYGPSSRPKVDLSWQGEIATVSWDPDRKTWYLAAWREDWGGILESAAPAPAMAKDMKKTLDAIVSAIIKDNISSRGIHRDYLKNIKDAQLEALKTAGYINWKIAGGGVSNIVLTSKTKDIYKLDDKEEEASHKEFLDGVNSWETDTLESSLKMYRGMLDIGAASESKSLLVKYLPQKIKALETELSKRKTDIPVAETASIDVDGLRVVVSIDNNQATDIPPGWIVFNAPRPMYGDKDWQGDPGHGTFYGAIDPHGERPEWMIKENKSLDGWVYQDISAATMTAMVRQNYIDGYFKNDAAKVDAAMAKIGIDQIRGQFFNVLEKMNYGAFKSLLAKSVQPEAKGTIKRFQSFEEFEKKYRWTFLEGGKYSPKQAGFNIYADELAKLSDAYPEWAEQAEQKWEDEHYSKLTVKEASTEQWRIDIRNAKTFQDIADVFKREFGVTVEDDPVMEAAVLEGWEDDLVSGGTSGDMKFKGGDWKDKLQAATTFDDIYIAFKEAGVLSSEMPYKPQAAIAVFDHADQLELLVADYNGAGTAAQRLETSELIHKSLSEDRNVPAHILARMVPGYKTVKPKSELTQEAGKEIFENAKAKGEELVTAWQTDPEIIPTAQHIPNKRAALESLEKERSAAELKYHTDIAAMESKIRYDKMVDGFVVEQGIVLSYVGSITDKLAKARPQTAEWLKLQEALSAMVAEAHATIAKHGEMAIGVWDELLASDEYQNLTSEYEAKEKAFTDKKQQLNAELSDAITKTYNPLIQKMLESSPITEKQAKKWASDQVIDKSVIKELAIETLVIGNSGFHTPAPVYSETIIRKDMAELYRLSGGRFGKCHILPRIQGQSRASADLEQRSIHAGDELTKRSLWHEMGHLIETDVKYVVVSTTFLDGRVDKTKGLIKLSVLTGDKGYRNDEVAYTDHLFSAYVGKHYGSGTATEVLSMGIQQFSSPELMHELGLKDPEMFKMILGILAITPSGLEKERLTDEQNQAKSEVDEKKAADAFYKMLDKKIKKNPDFYKPFAEIDFEIYHDEPRYAIESKEVKRGIKLFSLSAQSKQDALRIAYLCLALKQSDGSGGSLEHFIEWGHYLVKNRGIPTTISNTFPYWITKGIPDIKAA